MAEPDERDVSHGASRFKPAAQPHLRTSQAPRRSGFAKFLCFIAVLAVLVLVGFIFWRHRPVSVYVDGESRTVFMRSTVEDLFMDERPDVASGNLVSVTGNVLGEHQGNPFEAQVDGNEVSYEESRGYQLFGGENVSFTDGGDRLEEYTTEVTRMAPKLEVVVRDGTPEKGYMVQQGTVQYVSDWGQPGTHEVRHGVLSGETGDGTVVEEPRNTVVTVQNIHPDNDEKLVALTFDDGPSYFTETYLDILEQHGVKATFCIIGEQVADGAYVIGETDAAGHLIASHTWDHKQLTTLEADQVRQELGDTATALQDVIGANVNFLRPPYGDLDSGVWLGSGGNIAVSMYWTHDSLDWETPGVDAIVHNATEPMAPGSVILMHDGGGDRSQDVEALPRIIEAWQAAGYRFVTMRELLESDSSIDLSAVDLGSMPPDGMWPTELA